MQEVIRRLRNTQRDMDWSVKKDILSVLAWSLHLSGYSEQFRYDVIFSGIKGYEAHFEVLQNQILHLEEP